MSATRAGEATNSFAKRCLASIEALFKQHKQKYQPLAQADANKTRTEEAARTSSDASCLDNQRSNMLAADNATGEHGLRRSSQDTISVASSSAEYGSASSSPTSGQTGRATSTITSAQTQPQPVAKESPLRHAQTQTETAAQPELEGRKNVQSPLQVAKVQASRTVPVPTRAPPPVPTNVAPAHPKQHQSTTTQINQTPAPQPATQPAPQPAAPQQVSGAVKAMQAPTKKPRPNLLPAGFNLQPTFASDLARRRAESKVHLLYL